MIATTRQDLLHSEETGLPLSDVIDERERVARNDNLRPRLSADLCMTDAALDRALAAIVRNQTESARFMAGVLPADDDEDWGEWDDEDEDEAGQADIDARNGPDHDDDPEDFYMTNEEARREAADERGELDGEG